MTARILPRLATRVLSTRAASRVPSGLISHKSSIPLTSSPSVTSRFYRWTTTTAFATAIGLTAVTASVATASSDPETIISKEEMAAAAAALHDLLDNVEDDGLGPTLVRLAWHASGTYDKHSDTGGSEGATMRFSPESDHGANAGLAVAREALEPIKKLFPQIT